MQPSYLINSHFSLFSSFILNSLKMQYVYLNTKILSKNLYVLVMLTANTTTN